MVLLLLTVGQVQVSVSYATDGMVPVTPFLTSTPILPFVAFITFQREMDSKESEAGRWSTQTPTMSWGGHEGM